MSMRIGGLASGMDIDQLVKDLMKAERIPMDKMEQKKQLLEWQRDDYREMNKLLFDLNNSAFDMLLSSSFQVKNVTSSDSSKITATASSSAGNTTYSITKVEQLASSAYNVATDKTTLDPTASLWSQKDKMSTVVWDDKYSDVISVTKAGNQFSLSNKNIESAPFTPGVGANLIRVVQEDGTNKDFTVVTDRADFVGENQVYVDLETGDLTFSEELQAGSRIEAKYRFYQDQSVTVGENGLKEWQLSKVGITDIKGDTISVTKDDEEKIYTRVQNLADLDPDSNQFYLDSDTGKVTFSHSLSEGSKVNTSYQYETFDFSITTFDTDGNEVKQTFNVDGNTTLNTVIAGINNSKIGVSSFYDVMEQKVTLNRSQTGNMNENGKEMLLSGEFLSDVLHLDTANEAGGVNAKFTLNGLTTSRHSNTFAVNGVTFTLKDTFDSTTTSNPDAPVTISTTTDTEKVLENITKFIDKYNEVIEKINSEISEDRYRDYPPLTASQKEEMEEREIELWEERAKSGMLRNDSILESGLYQMRNNFYQTVDTGGTFKNLTEIGIETSVNYMSGGKLEIDEAKLKEALQNDPDAVYKLFAGEGSDEEQGILRNLRKSIDGIMDRIEEKAGNSSKTNAQFTLGKNLEDIDDRMDAFEDRLVQIENRYWRQFTEMEKAIQRTNQQSMFLMNQFGGGM